MLDHFQLIYMAFDCIGVGFGVGVRTGILSRGRAIPPGVKGVGIRLSISVSVLLAVRMVSFRLEVID